MPAFQIKFGGRSKIDMHSAKPVHSIYDHPEVFLLHDEDLRFCDWIKHTILMTTDKLVYLVHCTIPPQLQGEVHKCLDTWL